MGRIAFYWKAVGARIKWPDPDPPEWALLAGLPSPLPGEGFCEYAERLGLDTHSLTAGLNERTAMIANARLGSQIMRMAPEAFRRYLDARRAPWRW